MDMTLREICDTFGVSRRAVQGYEKAGLIGMCRKNKRGYLLYDENSQKRIRRIKLYQQMGFSIKEIKNVIDAADNVLRIALEEKVERLMRQKEETEVLIDKAYMLIEKLRT